MFADLDQEGINGLNNIFNLLKKKGYSVNLITHDDKIKDLADRTIVAKKKVFSELVEGEE
jgi:ABC-type lipoprotein export system ATPase subunit